jgi:hypothetical protein
MSSFFLNAPLLYQRGIESWEGSKPTYGKIAVVETMC